jgi:hypothetical protein
MTARRSSRRDAVRLFVALGLLAAWTARAEAQAYSPRRYVAQETAAAIQIDGRLDEAAWGAADVIGDFYLYQSGGVAAPPVRTARLLWDDDALYVGLEVLDAKIRSAGLGHDGALYEGDNAELFLAPTRGTTPYYEFEFSPNGDTFDARFTGGPNPIAYESALVSAVLRNGTDGNNADTDTGYTVEFSIPRASLAGFAAGDTWTFLAAGYDYHPTGGPTLYLSSPGPTPAGFHTLAIYDTLAFTAIPEPSSVALPGAGLLALLIRTRARRATRR